MIELFYRLNYRLKMWYMINIQKIDYFIIGFFFCDLLSVILHYQPSEFGYFLFDLFFLIIFIFLKWRESRE